MLKYCMPFVLQAHKHTQNTENIEYQNEQQLSEREEGVGIFFFFLSCTRFELQEFTLCLFCKLKIDGPKPASSFHLKLRKCFN